jgi:predicted NBD/HSP70 family sugar kinase
VVVRIDEGVGAGLVLDGVLHIGRAGGGGELGHVVLDPDGPPCECGKHGCLETFVSVPLIEQRLRNDERDTGVDSRDADELVEAGRALGQGLAVLLSALDVAHVVVSGTEEVLSEPFRRAVHDVVAERTLTDFARRLAIRETSFHDHDVVLGAAALVLDRELGIR